MTAAILGALVAVVFTCVMHIRRSRPPSPTATPLHCAHASATVYLGQFGEVRCSKCRARFPPSVLLSGERRYDQEANP